MSHHGNDGGLSQFYNKNFKPDENFLSKIFKNESPTLETSIGATGQFPEGKLTESDEGGIKFACTVYENKLIMNFGVKPITWIGFTKDEAKSLSNYILNKVEEMK